MGIRSAAHVYYALTVYKKSKGMSLKTPESQENVAQNPMIRCHPIPNTATSAHAWATHATQTLLYCK